MGVDLLITSASRPELLSTAVDSLHKHLKFSGAIRYLLHEDMQRSESSSKVINWAKESELFDVIESSVAVVGLGKAIEIMLPLIKTEFMFKFEDDMQLTRDIDLDEAVRVLRNCPDVNQITYHKRRTLHKKHEFVKKTVTRDGVRLTSTPHWGFGPGVWRMSYIRPRWTAESPARNVNLRLKGGHGFRGADWMIENVGNYYYGEIGEEPFWKHLGTVSARKGEVRGATI